MATPKKPGLRVVSAPPEKRELAPEHREHLHTSGLTDERIDAVGFYTELANKRVAEMLGISRWQNGRVLVLPFFVPGRTEMVMCRVRPDRPRLDRKKSTPEKPSYRKYEQPYGVPTIPYFPLGARTDDRLKDPSRPLIFTEGEKKAELLDQLGYAVVGAVGVYNFHDKPHADANDEWRFHPLILEHCVLKDRTVLICFDSDVLSKSQVLIAEGRVAGMALAAGANPKGIRIPDDEKKYGIDDWYVAFGREALDRVLAQPVDVDPSPTTDLHALVKHFRQLDGSGVPGKLRLPAGYEIDGIGRLVRQSEESLELIERAPILIARQLRGLYSGETLVELAFEAGGAWRRAIVSREAICDRSKAIGALAPIGAPIDSNTAAKVVTWLRDFEHVNGDRLERIASVDRLGWHGEDRFMLGERLIADDEAEPLVMDTRGREELVRAFDAKGTYEAHLDALRRAWEAEPLAALMICASLAAPLLRHLGAPDFAVHLAGDSSRGKSSALKIGASVYADVANRLWVASWGSSPAAHEIRAMQLTDLPLPIDEAGVASDPRVRERIVYTLMNGGGRMLARRDSSGLREMRQWHCIVMSTGEALLAPEDSATGAQTRVLQYRMAGFGRLDAAGVDAVRDAAEANAGQVGREWIGALAAIGDWEPYRAALKACTKQFQSKAVNGPRARQAAFYAVLATAEAMAAEVLGIGSTTGETMSGLFMRQGEDDGQEEVRPAAERALDLVSEWVASRPASFLPLRVSTSGKKEPAGEGRAHEVLGYLDEDAFLIMPNALHTFLREHGIDDKVVAADWKTAGLTEVNEKGRLTGRRRVAGRNQRFVVLRRSAIGWDNDDSSEYAD